MMNRYLQSLLATAVLAERRAWEQVKTRADWERFRDSRMQAYRDSLGQFPPQAPPLDVRISARHQGDGYTLENLVFQSRPGFYVTANLYLPAHRSGPVPGIVLIHSQHFPKTEWELQDCGVVWARAGAAVLVIERPGYGERAETNTWYRQAYASLFTFTKQLFLVGESDTAWGTWDVMRSIDFPLLHKWFGIPWPSAKDQAILPSTDLSTNIDREAARRQEAVRLRPDSDLLSIPPSLNAELKRRPLHQIAYEMALAQLQAARSRRQSLTPEASADSIRKELEPKLAIFSRPLRRRWKCLPIAPPRVRVWKRSAWRWRAAFRSRNCCYCRRDRRAAESWDCGLPARCPRHRRNLFPAAGLPLWRPRPAGVRPLGEPAWIPAEGSPHSPRLPSQPPGYWPREACGVGRNVRQNESGAPLFRRARIRSGSPDSASRRSHGSAPRPAHGPL